MFSTFSFSQILHDCRLNIKGQALLPWYTHDLRKPTMLRPSWDLWKIKISNFSFSFARFYTTKWYLLDTYGSYEQNKLKFVQIRTREGIHWSCFNDILMYFCNRIDTRVNEVYSKLHLPTSSKWPNSSCPRCGKKCSKFIKIWCAESP